jgi:hypothetical protein
MTAKRKPKAEQQPIPARSIADFNHERQVLDASHAQNESGRDTFLGLAHTAMFAASISFVGDVTPVSYTHLRAHETM